MLRSIAAAATLAALAGAGCSRSDQSPRPEHSKVAAAMPDAASTPGAQGPATIAPHAPPPRTATLSDTHPEIAQGSPAAATGNQAAGKADAGRSP